MEKVLAEGMGFILGFFIYSFLIKGEGFQESITRALFVGISTTILVNWLRNNIFGG